MQPLAVSNPLTHSELPEGALQSLIDVALSSRGSRR